MKKNIILNKLVAIFIIIILMILPKIDFIKYDNKLLYMIILFFISYMIFLISMIIFERKEVLSDIYFIYPSTFFMYSIFGPLFIILFKKPMTSELLSDYNIVLKTSYYYYYIFIILTLLIILFYKDNRYIKNTLNKKFYINRKIILFDIITFIYYTYFISKFFLNGGVTLFLLDKSAFVGNLNVYSDKILIYGDLWMISYSFYIIASKLTELLDGKKFKINFIRFIFIFSYWGIYLKAGVRRGALFLICMLFFWILSKNINKKKCIGYMTLVFIFLLLLGYIRNKVQSVDISYIYINSLGEFILPQWISYYYIYNPKPLLLGKTYLYIFMYIFPKVLLPNKPEDLGMVFWKEAGTNTALAFNPVAEGIINFGNLAIIFVPIIIFVLIFFVRKFKKRQLLYFVFCGAALNFMRGAMANFIFECLFVFICIKIMNVTIIDKFKGEIYEKQL